MHITFPPPLNIVTALSSLLLQQTDWVTELHIIIVYVANDVSPVTSNPDMER